MPTSKTLRICNKGHRYYKSTDCPTCPVCEMEKKPATGFLAMLASPARNALLREGIKTVARLSKYSEADILKLHGMGKASLPVLRKALRDSGRSFTKQG